jgi:hypothetical protein
MTSTRRLGRQGSARVMTAAQRAFRTIRYVNQELTRAMEAIFRPAGAPQHPPAGQASAPPAPPVAAAVADRGRPADRAA